MRALRIVTRGASALFLAAAVMLTPSARADGASPLTLWYDHPAADWEREGLPIGNGAMGMMIMGAVAEEHLQFNEKTLWTGGPGSAQGYDFGLPQSSWANEVHAAQQDLAQRTRIAPEDMARRLGRPTEGYGDYQSFGELVLTFANASGDVSAYRRELDLAHGVAHVSYIQDGVRYTRDYFADYPDHVIVVRLSANRPHKISVSASLAIPDNRSKIVTVAHGRITASGALNDNHLQYETQVQVSAVGGTRKDGDGAVDVENATSVTIMLAAGTNYASTFPTYRGADPHPGVTARVTNAVAKGCAGLYAAHEADYRALFDRVRLDIGGAPSDQPTDHALAAYQGGATPQDRALEALYFQYGRYLLISSSRAGSLPANLQGVWNHVEHPPWNADYHVNINLQMNYWLAETTGLTETTAPLFDFVDALQPSGQAAAHIIFGAQGWTLFLNSDPWGFSGLISWPTAFWQPEAGAWLAQHYYEHYRFTGDERFLRERAYPIMKGAALMWLDVLVFDHRDNTLVVSPSYSPEHGSFSAGASMSQEIVWDLFTNTAEAADKVGDTVLRDHLRTALTHLDPGLRVGSWGQLQEWKEDWDDRHDDHRHVSHLFALHPGRQISPLTTPQYAQAARVSLEARGDGGTGWSKAWKINFWARLFDGDHAHLMLSQQLKESTLPNLWDTHPPFQIDGNFGATAGVAEMLLQSQNDELHILPALPSAWARGSVQGLRGRGGYTVDIAWSQGSAQSLRIHATRAGTVNIRSTLFAAPFLVTRENGRGVIATSGEGDRRTFAVRAGGVYVVRPQN
ncbi:MAG: glycoside hydrolase family 95 protein [Terricaulis silvestris]